MTFEPIKPLEYYVQKVLPAVYDDSLSYYELLAKVVAQLNDLTHVVNLYGGQINDEVREMLNTWLTDGTMEQIVNEEIFEKIQNQLADPRYFGAKGDGVTDDTDALELWLATPGKSRILRNGEFLASRELVSTEANRDIKSEGGTIKALTQDMTVLTVTGDYSCVSVSINGDRRAGIGVFVDGAKGVWVSKSKITDLYGISVGATGIKAQTNYGVHIRDNQIINVDSATNTTWGDNVGASRAILLTDKDNTHAKEYSTIYDNYCENIIGEEGDAIQVLFYDSVNPTFLSALCDIRDNTIRNVNRRAIKVQGSDVLVKDNTHTNTLTNLQAPATLMEAINCHNVTFDGNEMDARGGFMGISAQGSDGVKMDNITIRKNIIKGHTTKDGMYLNELADPIVEDNLIYDGGRGISIGNASHGVVSRNKLFGGDGVNTGINISQTCAYMVVQGNTGHAINRPSLITISAPYCVVTENHNDTGVCVTSSSTAGRAIVKNNTSYSNESPTYNGDFSVALKGDGFNIGGGGSAAGIILYDIAPPTQHNFNRGDIVINTNVVGGGSVGWVCVESGSPGVWKSWGSVNA